MPSKNPILVFFFEEIVDKQIDFLLDVPREKLLINQRLKCSISIKGNILLIEV
jgi:hypothetical protein